MRRYDSVAAVEHARSLIAGAGRLAIQRFSDYTDSALFRRAT